jgi:hypothetical protein
MRRKIKWPSERELLKLNLRSHDGFGQMQPLWFLEDLQRLQGVKPRNTGKLTVTPLYSSAQKPAREGKATTKTRKKKTRLHTSFSLIGLKLLGSCCRNVSGDEAVDQAFDAMVVDRRRVVQRIGRRGVNHVLGHLKPHAMPHRTAPTTRGRLFQGKINVRMTLGLSTHETCHG